MLSCPFLVLVYLTLTFFDHNKKQHFFLSQSLYGPDNGRSSLRYVRFECRRVPRLALLKILAFQRCFPAMSKPSGLSRLGLVVQISVKLKLQLVKIAWLCLAHPCTWNMQQHVFVGMTAHKRWVSSRAGLLTDYVSDFMHVAYCSKAGGTCKIYGNMQGESPLKKGLFHRKSNWL